MLAPYQNALTLRDLRQQRQLSHQDLVAAIAQITGQPPKHWTASLQYERRGLKDVDVMESLAKVYGVSLEEIAAAARNSRQSGIPEHDRRRRQK